jgi:ABC-type transport system substrate-binding protein
VNRTAIATLLIATTFSSTARFAAAGPAAEKADSRAPMVWYGDAAYSADPADFDAGIHHIAFTPVQAWMVVDYRPGGGYQGEIAESYTVSEDSKTYTFILRPGMTYENGDPIKPQDVVDCWTRLVRVLKAKGSSAGAFVHVVGYDDFPDHASTVAGFSYNDRTVTVRFSKPQPKFLDDLTFGIYALAHPSLYDHATGRWLDPKKVIASGPYRVQEWDKHHLRLALRSDYPATMRHPNAFPAIDIRWEQKAFKDADLVWGSLEQELGSRGYLFQGGEAPGVDYLQCESWKDPASPLASLAVRRRLRAAFYEEMAKSPIHLDKSFYPLYMKDVRDPSGPLDAADAAVEIPKGARLRFHQTTSPPNPLNVAVFKALKKAAERLGFRFQIVHVPFGQEFSLWASSAPAASLIDVAWFGTRIDVGDPVGEAHFMFETKNGVCLPDPTGKAAAAFSRPSANAQDFNQILWDDAIIWTLDHTTGGWWRKPDVDFSLFNSSADVPAVQMMGWKQ